MNCGLRTIAAAVAMVSVVSVEVAAKPLPPTADTPVEFLGHAVVYAGDTLELSPKALFVDGNLTDAEVAECPFAFNSIQEAVRRLTDGTPSEPMRVYVAPWVYWIDDPDSPAVATGSNGREPFGMVIRCNNLHLIGLAKDARDVVFAAMRGHMQGARGNFTMLDIHGDGLQVSNMTLGNFCNVDLEYPLNPALARRKRSPAITQAHVAYCHGDRALARNVRFISRLNLNPLNGARRILYDRCHFECTDDALTGNGIYLHCTIDLYGQKPFYTTAATGAVFLACRFTSKTANRSMVFCKSPGPLALIDCAYSAPDSVRIGWANYPERWLRCFQAGFTLNGKPYKVGSEMPENTVCIDSLPMLSAYRTVADGDTLYNTYNLLRGDDDWDPLGVAPRIKSALGFCGGELPTALAMNVRKISVTAGETPFRLTATALRQGGYAMPADADTAVVRWSVNSGGERFVRLMPHGDGSCDVESVNDDDTVATVCVVASTSAGLQAAVEVVARPRLLPAPEFVEKPRIEIGDTLFLSYTLRLDGRADCSRVTWYRCKDASGRGGVPVAVSRGGTPLLAYSLTEADVGWHIMAKVEPAHMRSLPGDAAVAVTEQPVDASSVAQSSIVETDFSALPTSWQPMVQPGFWTVDGFKPKDTSDYDWSFDSSKDMWTYGEGFNGAVGLGLLQAQRGARLLYTPVASRCGDMRVTLQVDPTKTAGQGFGSATGQYMDVYIKFDTRTLTGYALRIERTPKSSRAVDFTLVEYVDGATRPISESVTSTCYRTGCTITLEARGSRLFAHVETASPAPADSSLPAVVDLAADIAPSVNGGSGVQHTGSCGESTTMLHRMKIEYFGD